MKRLLLFLAALLFPVAIGAQTATYSGFCDQGGVSAVTSGLSSTNRLQGIIPYCTVTVYLTGTTTKATIYKDAVNTPQTNPYRTSVNGQITFYAAPGHGYDIVKSGGISPLIYTTPLTVTDWIIGGGGISGGGTAGYLPVWTGTTALGNSVIDQDVTTAGQVTVTDGLTVNATGTENVSMGTQAGQDIQLVPGQTLGIYSNSSNTSNRLAIFGGSGAVVFANQANDNSAGVVFDSGGTCGTDFYGNPLECAMESNGGALFTDQVMVDSVISATASINSLSPINTLALINTDQGLTIAATQGTPGSPATYLVCLDASGNAENCPVSATTWDGIDGGTHWLQSGQRAIQISGYASCTFDNTPIANDYVIPSATTAGKCHDNGTTLGAPLVGKVTGGSISGSTASVELYSLGPQTSSGTLVDTATMDNGTLPAAFTTLIVGGDTSISAGPRAFLQASTGSITAIVANGQYGPAQVVKAGTIENIIGVATTFTCSVNPTFTLEDCGASAGACGSPTALANVTVTAAGTSVSGTVTSATLTAGDYLVWETTAGTCTVLNFSASAEYRMN